MTEPVFESASDADGGGDDRRRKLIVGGGIGAIALIAVGGYALLSGGSSSSSVAVPVTPHVVPTAAAAASPSPSASREAVLPVFHGDVASRDPFGLPAALQAVTATAAAAAPGAAAGAPAAAAPAAGASAVPTALPSGFTLPTTVAGPGGTTVSVLPGSSGSPTTVTVSPMADEYLQLLGAKHIGGGWIVDVRSASGVVKAVKPGTKNVAGTLFYYDGEDETSGSPTFVFELGESKGGNLVPNAKESTKHVHADKSTLVLHDGNVDGGIYAE